MGDSDGVKVEQVESAFGSGHDIRISNAVVELLVPTGFGPRVLGYRLGQGENIFGWLPPERFAEPTAFGEPWHPYGGHRLWCAPEDPVATYHPDDAKVRWTLHERGVTVVQDAPAATGLEKWITVTLEIASSVVTVEHRVVNRGADPVVVAPWALTVMRPGGQALWPNPTFVPHPEGLAPARALVLWPYTELGDPRWSFGRCLSGLRHDPARASAQKIGFSDSVGWLAYASQGDLFVKTHRPFPGVHADLGCNVEIFTNGAILELETLGPLATLGPGRGVVHGERWALFGDVELPTDDADAARLIEGLAAEMR